MKPDMIKRMIEEALDPVHAALDTLEAEVAKLKVPTAEPKPRKQVVHAEK